MNTPGFALRPGATPGCHVDVCSQEDERPEFDLLLASSRYVDRAD